MTLSAVLSASHLLVVMSKNEFKSRYSSNYAGILWAFIQPSITIAIFWFVFSVGFKSAPINNVPFILWLIAGMIPWFFFAEAVSSTTTSILESSFLVKKIAFQIILLPIVKIISALAIHLFFLFFMLGMFMYYGYYPTYYWIQLIYYVISSIILVIGIGLFASSVVIFFRDLNQIIGMGIQFGFWLTPIFWTLSMLPQQYIWIFKLNPIYYISQGFRDSLIGGVWFWEKPIETLIFWIINIFLLVLGMIVFNKLRPHFADVI